MKQGPKYQILADVIRKNIEEGQYPDGYALKTEFELTEQYSMSRQTVRQALSVLEKEGLIERKRGSGTYVRQKKMRREKTMTIGVVVTFMSEYIFPSIIRGIESELSANKYTMKLSATNNFVVNERQILNEYLKKPVDGLIIEGIKTNLPNPNIDIYRKLSDAGIPYIFIDGYYSALKDAAYVISDDCAAGKRAVQYLARKGHKRIAGLFSVDTMQGARRYQGFVDGLMEENLEICEKSIIWFTLKSAENMFKDEHGSDVLKALEGCTAIVCQADIVAVMLFDLLQKAGLRVPEDMAIISFDNSMYSELNAVRITSMNHPKEEMGCIAVRELLNMIDGKHNENIMLPMDLVEKEST